MAGPLTLETIVAEFSEEYEVWVLQDAKSRQYVVIPHEKYPGRKPIHFFMSKQDAQQVLQELLDVNAKLAFQHVIPTKVRLLEACRGIAATAGHGATADSFVVHPPNEVFEFLRGKGSEA